MMSQRSESFGYFSPSVGLELLDQGEDEAVVFGEQLLQVLASFRPGLLVSVTAPVVVKFL